MNLSSKARVTGIEISHQVASPNTIAAVAAAP